MTKAFTPQGLLSAGLQDKQERSAKRQEELARESGNSLVNVPSKPPPPQTGLLGAITGYERDRKRDGGVGAALTERERDRRVAEDRQRKLDDFQKMQLDQQQQMAQGGSAFSIYGGANPMSQYLNPMMANPMMMGGYGGYPMMGGYSNPQQMFAAQQAAQAYQQAMMTYSQAGSQMGGDGGGNSPGGGMASPMGQMSPQMSPQMGMGMGFDPRMSMMNMGMMSPMPTGGAWGDPRMSMFSPGPGMPGMPGMDMNNGMQSPMGMGMNMNGGFSPQHTGMPPGGSPQFGPQQGASFRGSAATPPLRGSANASPKPPLPPPPPPQS